MVYLRQLVTIIEKENLPFQFLIFVYFFFFIESNNTDASKDTKSFIDLSQIEANLNLLCKQLDLLVNESIIIQIISLQRPINLTGPVIKKNEGVQAKHEVSGLIYCFLLFFCCCC